MAGESAWERSRRAREKSEQLARYADRWEKGAEGETRTAAALACLGPEWTSWHDLKWPGRRYANIDHIVIGPGGIFVIDSKNWSGEITATGNVLRQNGYRREKEVAGCADSALAVGELLPRYLERVKPVLCFTRDEPIEGLAREVLLCSTSNVVTMLTTRPAVLATDEIVDAVLTLQARMNSMPTQPPLAASPSPRPESLMSWSTSHRRPAPTPTRQTSGRRNAGRIALRIVLVYVALSLVLGALWNLGSVVIEGTRTEQPPAPAGQVRD